MTFADFFSRFSHWRSQHELVSPEKLETAFTDTQLALERALVQKGRLIIKQLEYLEEKEEQCRQERSRCRAELQDLSTETQLSEELLSGERISFDLSQGKRWQAFWEEAQAFLAEKTKALRLSVSVSPQKKELTVKKVPEQLQQLSLSQQDTQKKLQQLYDVRHLEQESDELLHYL
jgi:predicted ATP-grasp superfamily ATP-dependent carboligase